MVLKEKCGTPRRSNPYRPGLTSESWKEKEETKGVELKSKVAVDAQVLND